MPIFFILPSVRRVYFLFKDLFVELEMSYAVSCAFLMMFLTRAAGFSALVRTLPGAPSVSTLSRAAMSFRPNRFMRRNQSRILRALAKRGHGDFCFAVDDTANPKYGSTFCSNFHSSSGPFFGQKILVLVIVDLKLNHALPISYVFLSNKKDPNHIPAHYRALDLIEAAIQEGFPPLPVTSDSWFDSKEFIKAVVDLGCTFAGELKGNRIVRGGPSGAISSGLARIFKKSLKIRLPQSRHQKRKEKRGKAYSQRRLYINQLNIPLKVIAVYNRINGNKPFAYYATNNTSMTGVQLWMYSRGRWAIEVLFRELKQSLGFGSLTSGSEGGTHMAVCIPLILLTSIRLDSEMIWNSKGRETLGTIVKRTCEEGLTKTIDALIFQPKTKKTAQLLARRRHPTKKPTNLCGEKMSA